MSLICSPKNCLVALISASGPNWERMLSMITFLILGLLYLTSDHPDWLMSLSNGWLDADGALSSFGNFSFVNSVMFTLCYGCCSCAIEVLLLCCEVCAFVRCGVLRLVSVSSSSGDEIYC